MVGKKTRDKIIDILKNHPEGLLILDISRLIGVSRVTVSKYVYALTLEGVISQRQIGAAKLCLLEKEGKR